jgi:glycosyltransferase involved in cell wall biosynthesis
MNYKWSIVVGNNGVRKDCVEIVKKLMKKNKRLKYLDINTAGKGASVLQLFEESKADLLGFIDVDLSGDLNDLGNMLKEIENGAEIVSGSRNIKGSITNRSFKRRLFAKVYTWFFVRILLGMNLTDPQCGYKIITNKAAKILKPLIKDHVWFFETEMMYLALKLGMNVKEIPVKWTDYGKSGVRLIKTSLDFVKKSIELRFRRI